MRPSGRNSVLIQRAVRRFIARVLVGMMVLAQMTVAAYAYACPGAQGKSMNVGRSATDVGIASTTMNGMAGGYTGHRAIDPAEANLCAAHCQSGQQNADGRPEPHVPVALPVALYPQASMTIAARSLGVSAHPDDPPPMPDPPHAILHCCFRI